MIGVASAAGKPASRSLARASVTCHEFLAFFRRRPESARRHALKRARWETPLQILIFFYAPQTGVDRHQPASEVVERRVLPHVVILSRERTGVEPNDTRQTSRVFLGFYVLV